MKIVISVLLISMVAMLARGWKLKGEVGTGVLVGAGMAGGLIQGSTGLGGPPVVAVALSRPGPVRQQRANVLGMMAAISLASLVSLWWFGFFTRQVIIIALLLLPLYILSGTLGSRYFSQNGQRVFRPLALAVLAVIGLTTLVAAVRQALV